MPSPSQITVAQLSRLIGLPSAPVVLDVRTEEDFRADPRLIPTAQRHRSDDLAQLDAAMSLYDAFYRWCRDATEETHG